jgi:hypothetical protein
MELAKIYYGEKAEFRGSLRNIYHFHRSGLMFVEVVQLTNTVPVASIKL